MLSVCITRRPMRGAVETAVSVPLLTGRKYFTLKSSETIPPPEFRRCRKSFVRIIAFAIPVSTSEAIVPPWMIPAGWQRSSRKGSRITIPAGIAFQKFHAKQFEEREFLEK